MTALLRVLACMLVRRVVAAARGTALLARAQVKPAGAGLDAFIALTLDRMLDRGDGADVFAGFVRHLSETGIDAAPRGGTYISGSEIDLAVITSVRPGRISA